MQTQQFTDYRFTNHGFETGAERVDNSCKLQTYKGAYISITSSCNTDVCSYCYARAEKKTGPMSQERFETALDWLATVSDFPEVYLVGGEPTIVPHLSQLLDSVARRLWRATIYTNGAFSAQKCLELSSHPGLGRLAFHYEPAFVSLYKDYKQRLIENISVLAKVKECSIVFVIMNPTFNYDEVINIASSHKIGITWVFGAPSAGGTPYVGLKTMRKAGPKVQEFLLAARERGIKVAPDLPVPLCIFDEGFRTRHGDEFKLNRRCKPFAYIKSDLSIQSCTAMPCNSAPPPNNANDLLNTILKHRAIDSELKKKPSFPECENCIHHLNETCQGGCMTYKVYSDPRLEL